MYGGPFTHEVDAIRDERNRAAAMDEKPNFKRIFKGVDLSDGAKEILKDIERPVEDQVFVPHDYSHEPTTNVKFEEKEEKVEEENSPEGTGKENAPEGDKEAEKDSSQQNTSSVGTLENILEGFDKK